jgi:hypothetical protein
MSLACANEGILHPAVRRVRGVLASPSGELGGTLEVWQALERMTSHLKVAPA